MRLEEILHQRIVGQKEAVAAVARAIRRGRVGLKDPKRPIGSFLFLGPTGVGKTELCKALAQAMFGDEKGHDPHGYVGIYGKAHGFPDDRLAAWLRRLSGGGQLTEKIRRKPYSVVLFDEIEKAHPDVFHLLLQILEDGQLTDSQGRTVDFKNAVVIMTSNIGARLITENRLNLGFSADNSQEADQKVMRDKVMEELKKAFRPEFLNRIDDIIVFQKLTQEEIQQIAVHMLNDLKARLEPLGVSLEFTEEAVRTIAKAGFDPVYGARPLRREIQTKVEDPLSEELLAGDLKAGGTAVCDASGGKIIFQIQEKRID